MITVVHCKRESSEYVGRPSPLGNPFILHNEEDRMLVIRQYEKWLIKKIRNKDARVITELRRLRRIAEKGELKLGCWCSPKPCHADVIKKILERRIKRNESN